jgi:prevent-host-death family protein
MMYKMYIKYDMYLKGEPMARMNTSDARHEFAEVINRAAYRGERIVLHRRGRDVAAIISLEDLELLERLEDENDVKAAKAALREAKKKGTKPLTQVMEELGIER